MDINAKIESLKLVPVVVLEDAKDALPLAKALIDGGLPVAEVTFRTAAAEDSIRAISEAYPEMLVGAGTVTNLEQAKTAVAAGAKFLVTPGFSDEVTRYAVENDIPIFPGTCTPTEVMRAMSYGLKVVKFFPASQYGGLNTIKALSGPFPAMRFMPTGGINAGNVKEYLANKHIIACGGSWMVKSDLIAAGKFDEIKRLTQEAVALVNEG
ncbi:MAG: bifunctional 4-hydroxy-2-oxoglutarate aldolase/2-dehydro-3-deoxy-phosphogluconate aldolase [Oscillospiraceae bacterium]|nr:bifunctional 4-hydroxy-2-oxoglutarate aldolase/2-dehydro-3-deoxy-phosphogluconate aldolase [Oscillospiraceae bacterium]